MQNEPTQNEPETESTASSIKSSSSTSNFLDFRSTSRLGEKLLSQNSHNNDLKYVANGGVSKADTLRGQDCFFEDPGEAEGLLKWSALVNIIPLLGGYGGPSCVFLTKACIVVGTIKGPIMIYTRKQSLVNCLIPKLSTDLGPNYLRSSVESIAISSDGTYLAANYKTGDVFLWNLNLSDDNSAVSSSSTDTTGIKQLKAVINITHHRNRIVNGLGFIGARHTGLIVSDTNGDIMYHSGFRNGIWSLTYSSKQVLNSFSKEKLLCTQTAPYTEEETNLHMVAVLTDYAFAIITTSPRLATLYLDKFSLQAKNAKPENSCLLWRRYMSKVAFSIDCKLTVYCLNVPAILGNTIIKKMVWKSNEGIVSLQWATENLIGVLTASQKFIILDTLQDLKTVTQVDLLTHDLMNPPRKHFAVFNKELVLSTHYNMIVGKFLSWSEITLRNIQRGDYLGALKFLGSVLRVDFALSGLIGLKENIVERKTQLLLPFHNLALASLRFVLQKKDIDHDELSQLLSLILIVLRKFDHDEIASECSNNFLEKALDCFSAKNQTLFFDIVSNAVLDGILDTLPPEVFKGLLEHYSKLKKTNLLEELIIMLDPKMLDIDLAVKICQKYDLFDVLVYIWNRVFNDYDTPLIDAIYKISGNNDRCVMFSSMNMSEMDQIFDYLSFILTGRQYPQNVIIESPQVRIDAKLSLYSILFSGTSITWPFDGGNKLYTKKDSKDEPAFPYFKLLLKYNPRRLLSMLNEVFEDDFLNDIDDNKKYEEADIQLSRQYIVHLMLDIMKEERASSETVLLAIFISSNIAKYPQFIRVSNRALEELIHVICSHDVWGLENESQLALEALLTVYSPRNAENFIVVVKQRRYNRVLFALLNKLRRYSDLLLFVLESTDTKEEYGRDFGTILRGILNETKGEVQMKSPIVEIIQDNFEKILSRVPLKDTVKLFDEYDPEIHNHIFSLQDEHAQMCYLEALFNTDCSHSQDRVQLVTSYITLCCRHKGNKNLLPILRSFPLQNVDVQAVLNSLIEKSNFEGAGIIHDRIHDYNAVIDDILHCIKNWFFQTERQYETLDGYLSMAIKAANSSSFNKELNWSRLIACLITIYGNASRNVGDQHACNKAIQRIFVNLALSECSDEESKLQQFWSILTSALENKEVIMRKIHELENLLLDIFTAYNIEEHISRILLRIVRNSSTDLVQIYQNEVERGWAIRNEECEVCGKIIWGLGIDSVIFQGWQAKRQGFHSSIGEPEFSPTVVFVCHHAFHESCLLNLGQKKNMYFCLICKH